jgi:hypothetical protein
MLVPLLRRNFDVRAAGIHDTAINNVVNGWQPGPNQPDVFRPYNQCL